VKAMSPRRESLTRPSELRELQTTDDYHTAWRRADAGEGWIAYRHDYDYLCSPGVIAFDDDIWDGGVGFCATETHLAGFLFALQQQDRVPGSDESAYEFPPRGEMVKDMLDHEVYLLDDPVAGSAWRRLRKEKRLLYASFVYSLYRQKWAKKWVQLASMTIGALDAAGVRVDHLRTVRRVDPLMLGRARKYKADAGHVPARLLRPLKAFRELAKSDSAVSSSARTALKKEMREYEKFLVEYRRRRNSRFSEIAEDDFLTVAGLHGNLLSDSRGQPSPDVLVQRAVKAVAISLTDELVNDYGISERKAAPLAARVASLLFIDAKPNARIKPFDRAYAKKAVNDYRYAKRPRPSV